MPSKRLFIALNLPADVRKALEIVEDTIRAKNKRVDIKWVKPEIIHLTLHFLGWTDEARVEMVKSLISEAIAGIGSLEVRLGQLGCFPDARRSRVVWVALGETPSPMSIGRGQGSGSLRKLHARLRDALAKAGFEVDTRPWQTHLTLGRLRVPQMLKGLDTDAPSLQFTIDHVDLMESVLHPEGPEYAVLESYALHP